MSKTIKFNLICDGESIRTLDDLKNHFSIEDILGYYNNGLLKRWLTVRGYTAELQAVNELKEEDELELVKKLIGIFDVEYDQEQVKKDTYILKYLKLKKEQAEQIKEDLFRLDSVVQDYHGGYEALIDNMICCKDDMAVIKAFVAEIADNYFELFKLNYRELFYRLLKEAPMAIFAMLMQESMRKYLLYSENDTDQTLSEEDKAFQDAFVNKNKEEMFNELEQLRKNYTNLKQILGNNLKEFSGQTDSYWKDLEPKGKKCMILSMISGNFVREAGNKDGDKPANVVNGRYLIFNGIDYKSNSTTEKLLYLEV